MQNRSDARRTTGRPRPHATLEKVAATVPDDTKPTTPELVSDEDQAALDRIKNHYRLVKSKLTQAHGSVSTDVALRSIERSPLLPLQRMVIVALYNAPRSSMRASELYGLMNFAPGQFDGFLGNFAARVTATPGYGGGSFFCTYHDSASNELVYFLDERVREAMRQARIV